VLPDLCLTGVLTDLCLTGVLTDLCLTGVLTDLCLTCIVTKVWTRRAGFDSRDEQQTLILFPSAQAGSTAHSVSY
jgi:hypothetical protein